MTTQEYVQQILESSFLATAEDERRCSDSQDLASLQLSDEQEMTLNSKRSFGWQIYCVRSPYLGKTEVIVTDPAQSAFWVLQQDGGLTQTYNVRTDDLS